MPLPSSDKRETKFTDLMPAANTDEWPSSDEMGFIESQWLAFKAALTQEFSLLQGNISLVIR